MARSGARRTTRADDPRHLRPLIEILVERLVPRGGQAVDWCPDVVVEIVGRARRSGRLGVGHVSEIVAALEALRGRCAELVDEPADARCRAWLDGDDEWWRRGDRAEGGAVVEPEDPSELRREMKKREAAERKAATAEARFAEQTATIDALRQRLGELEDALTASEAQRESLLEDLRGERVALRNERDRHAATRARLERATAETERAETERAEAEVVRDRVIDERRTLLDDAERLTEMVRNAETLLAGLRSLAPDQGADDRRRPVPIPGSCAGLPDRAAEFLLRFGGTVIVDAYNVTIGRLGHLPIAEQRERLLAGCEELAARTGADIVVAIDGADIAGAHTRTRRHIRVLYSAEGVDADDDIREEMARIPMSRAVIVVTDDRAVREDARKVGANLIDSGVFATLMWGE